VSVSFDRDFAVSKDHHGGRLLPSDTPHINVGRYTKIMDVTGRRAVEVIRSATSSRALNELQRVRARLAPWRRHAEVSDLNERIRALINQPA